VLLTNNYLPTDVVTIKTTYGEELITRITEETITTYVLNKPMCLISTPQGGFGLAPAAFSLKPGESVTLNKSAVALLGRTEADMAGQYMTHTTGIKLPGNNLI
jgi:hypothetical protein